jgi:hypothetical protein
MQILDIYQFLQTPPGTIYATGGKWWSSHLAMKGETYGDLWIEIPLTALEFDTKDTGEFVDKLEAGGEIPLDFSQSIGCSHESHNLYFVFSKEDVTNLIGVLQNVA